MLDSHCHLDFPEFDADRAELLLSARQAGVEGFLVPGTREELWAQQEALLSEAGVLLAVGLHPWWLSVASSVDQSVAQLEARARRLGAVAIGECGLDAKRTDVALASQLPFFEAQLELARTLELPVILHQVGAREEFLRALKRSGQGVRGVVHGFSGDASWGSALVARGLCLGFGSSVLSPKRSRLREAWLAVPAERLLVETDAPAGGAQGTRSVPADLARICHELSTLRELSAGQLGGLSDANLATLLGFSAPEELLRHERSADRVLPPEPLL